MTDFGHFLRTSFRIGVLYQAIPTPGLASPDYVAQRLFMLLYAGMFSSRLNLAIRERAGDSYGVSESLISWPGGGVSLVGTAVHEDAIGVVVSGRPDEVFPQLEALDAKVMYEDGSAP